MDNSITQRPESKLLGCSCVAAGVDESWFESTTEPEELEANGDDADDGTGVRLRNLENLTERLIVPALAKSSFQCLS